MSVEPTVASEPATLSIPARAPLWRRIDPVDAARTAFTLGCALAVAAGLTGPWPSVPLVAVVGLAVGCWPILVESWRDARNRRMSMELSMLIAIIAAAAIGEWVTALVVTGFVLAAEILEDLSFDRGHDALTDLMSFLPSHVRVRDGSELRTLPLAEVPVGATVLVAPGARVPVDGSVTAGRSSLDQSRITGEPLPVEVGPGSSVYAGSVNQLGALEVRAEQVGTASLYGHIADAVRAAQESQAPVQRLADRLAGYLVYVALGGAALTYLLTRDLTATISVILVAGACGIAAGTPLAVLGAIGRAARTGAFVKDGAHLEQLSAVDTVVFDKTGTLTEGRPEVTSVHPVIGTADDLVALAASADLPSEHPLALAIVTEARARGVRLTEPSAFTYRPGEGVIATVADREVRVGSTALAAADPATPAGGTAVHVAVAGVYTGTLVLADRPRPSAATCVADLRALGLRVVMLTGDAAATAQAVADELGIDEVRAGLLPADKLAAIDAERAAGHRVAMVGDGVNDAPALARADVGIAMGSGTEVARASADVVLVSSDLGDLTRTVRIARRARQIVLANFVGTLAVDALGMLLAAFGLLGPVLAAVVHVGSESAFILNSARLIPGRRVRADATDSPGR